MGVSYSAVKVTVPEAWEIGKDYYGLTDLFPACQGRPKSFFANILLPPISDLPYIVGSRHPYVSNAVFRVTDYYPDANSMISKIIALKNKEVDVDTDKHLTDFYNWAGNDPIQLIIDFDELEDRDASNEYQLCAKPSHYIHVDTYGGEAGRHIGVEE